MNRYFIVDTGRKMAKPAKVIEKWLLKEGYHYAIFLTDDDYYLGLEETTENKFLDLFSKEKTNTNGEA